MTGVGLLQAQVVGHDGCGGEQGGEHQQIAVGHAMRCEAVVARADDAYKFVFSVRQCLLLLLLLLGAIGSAAIAPAALSSSDKLAVCLIVVSSSR